MVNPFRLSVLPGVAFVMAPLNAPAVRVDNVPKGAKKALFFFCDLGVIHRISEC